MDPKEAMAHSMTQTDEIAIQSSNSLSRDIFIVLIVSLAARFAFVCMMPAGARSFDAFAWGTQAALFKEGTNPYLANDFFSWPPFWMQVVFIISKIAGFLNVPFFRVLQLCLIFIESLVIIQMMRLIHRIAPTANARAIAMIGIALNPVAILLVCQHCNFDVFIGLWVLLTAASLLRYNQSNSPIDWLCACLFLGLGILTKTVPLALIPLLAGGFRKATAPERLLGTALVLGPTALGMSIIYVLGPAGAMHVLEYRAKLGFYFGFPGFLNAMRMDHFVPWFDDAFYILGIGIIILTWRHLWKHNSLGDRETILYIAMVLLAIPSLGPGFGSQYYYWFLPFLVISYAAYRGLWRKLLIGFALISAITFIIDYSLDRAYGYNLLYILSQAATPYDLHQWTMTTRNNFSIRAIHWELWLESPANETMERIPLFIAVLTIIFIGTKILISGQRQLRLWVVGLAGFYAACVVLIFAAAFGAKYFGSGISTTAHPITRQSGARLVQN